MAAHVKVRVLFFAKAREIAETSRATLSLPNVELSVSDIVEKLEELFPQLSILRGSFILALNEEYLDGDGDLRVNLSEDDELAVIPPISGG